MRIKFAKGSLNLVQAGAFRQLGQKAARTGQQVADQFAELTDEQLAELVAKRKQAIEQRRRARLNAERKPKRRRRATSASGAGEFVRLAVPRAATITAERRAELREQCGVKPASGLAKLAAAIQ